MRAARRRGTIVNKARPEFLRAVVAGGLLLIAEIAFAQSLAPDIVVVKTINAPVAEVWKCGPRRTASKVFGRPRLRRSSRGPAVHSSCGSASSLLKARAAA